MVFWVLLFRFLPGIRLIRIALSFGLRTINEMISLALPYLNFSNGESAVRLINVTWLGCRSRISCLPFVAMAILGAHQSIAGGYYKAVEIGTN